MYCSHELTKKYYDISLYPVQNAPECFRVTRVSRFPGNRPGEADESAPEGLVTPLPEMLYINEIKYLPIM